MQYNQTCQTLLERRSYRKFKQEQIKEEELQTILEAGRYAPTGGDQQSPIFIVVQEQAMRERLDAMNAAVIDMEGNPYYEAPTLILVLADKSKNTALEDGSLALGNMMNAAASIGVGTCWIHRVREMFESSEGKKLLQAWGVHGEYVGVGSLAVGYPDEERQASQRKADSVFYVR